MDLENLPVTTQDDEIALTDKQLETWEVKRRAFANWLLERGKKPKSLTGYSAHTTKDTLYRTDHFARFVWDNDEFKTEFTHDEADEYMENILLDEDCSASHAEGTEKALKRLFKHYQSLDDDRTEWEPEYSIPKAGGKRNINDVFSEAEIEKLYNASLNYNQLPAYNDLTPVERSQWKGYIAMSLGKPKSEVVPDDWEKVDNWKIPSLVKVSIDAGLRPIEVERSKVSWLDLEDSRLIIPADESSKNRENWRVGISDMATRALKNWFEQRENIEKYEGRDEIWLTREGNPYSSSSLRYLILNLCEDAGINTQHRSVSWYSIRHATGTFYAKKGTLVDAQEQLRHTSAETTKKYVHSSSEERSNLANKR
ncbi:tyrosine-type recombinase/integrase [Natronomonas amylolytica]|uniref:tyrosine-type recombinase/integrase n=1 Tax=Natronomonas amylolytica TaxID=3108498 RepID=UPI00300A6AB6